MDNGVKNWEGLSRKEVFGNRWRKMEQVIFRLPDGTESDFYIKQEGLVVAILALTKNQEVILARQFRPGPKEILLELPCGKLEEEEDPKSAVQRELLEETGYQGEAVFVAESLHSAYSTEKKLCFVATDCEKVAEPKNTATEICETVLVSLVEFRRLLRSGRMTDVEVGYIGLDYLGLL